MEKHRHQIKRLEFLIKWLGYLKHPNTWNPEDHLSPALVQECFQQSPLENPTPTNAVLPKSDVYRSCQLLLNKKACWIIALMLNIVTVVASHSHCHFNPLFKKQNKPLVLSERNLTWKELLTYATTLRLKIRLHAARPEKTGQLYFLDWTLPPVLEKRLHIFNHLALGAYDPLSPKNTSLIQTVTHACCRLAINASERPHPLKNPNTVPWALSNSLYCYAPSYTFHC